MQFIVLQDAPSEAVVRKEVPPELRGCMANPGCHKRTGGGEDSSSYLHTPGVVK
jgi:hypothetical protein